MSTIPEPDFDLEKLFLPAWAKQPADYNKYSKFAGGEERERSGGRDDRGGGARRGPRRDFGGPPGRGGGAPMGGRGRGPSRGGEGGPRGGRFSRDAAPERREPPAPMPDVGITLMPDEKGVESLARQIKVTGRAYPLFDIAQIVLQKPERQQVRLQVIKKEGVVVQPLFLCVLDDSIWLSEDEAAAHVLAKHFETFYRAEKTPTDPPKGVFTFVAQCGISGEVLGPPNYHDYQNKLHKLHQERFSRMPFDVYKSRVKIVRDEAVVKKWLDDLSFKTEFVPLNIPEPEVAKLQNREAVEKHFREVHAGNIIRSVESHSLSAAGARTLLSPQLGRLVRAEQEDQRRFPLKLVNVLSQQFAQRGLQFFKVNKTITHVAVARPHYLDLEATPVSDGVRKIVEFINAHPRCTRRKLVETLAPSPTLLAVGEGAPAEPAAATPEQNVIIGDLHWLVHQGHVIEFANGTLETAKRPNPRPPKPEKKAPAPAAVEGGTAVAASAEVPNASVEEIAPAASALEAARPEVAAETPAEPVQEPGNPSEAAVATPASH